MEPLLTKDDLRCVQCKAMPIKIFETDCWGALLCQDCYKVNDCPANWGHNVLRCKTSPNRFLTIKLLNRLPAQCKYWNEEVPRVEIEQHWEQCPKNKRKLLLFLVNSISDIWPNNVSLVRSAIINPNLHSWVLYKYDQKSTWACAGTRIIQKGKLHLEVAISLI